MIDPAKLVAFVVVSSFVSLTPGPQMVFVMTQAAWRGHRAGFAALSGLQLGNAAWYLLAGLGLGTLAAAFPAAFTTLTVAGALYLAWLGFKALRHAGEAAEEGAGPPPRATRHALRDTLVVSLSNPKSLVYVLAILPPFIDARSPVMPQIALLAPIGITIDFAIGAIYALAGGGLSKAMQRPAVRQWLERSVGTIFLALAGFILFELIRRSGAL